MTFQLPSSIVCDQSKWTLIRFLELQKVHRNPPKVQPELNISWSWINIPMMFLSKIVFFSMPPNHQLPHYRNGVALLTLPSNLGHFRVICVVRDHQAASAWTFFHPSHDWENAWCLIIFHLSLCGKRGRGRGWWPSNLSLTKKPTEYLSMISFCIIWEGVKNPGWTFSWRSLESFGWVERSWCWPS